MAKKRRKKKGKTGKGRGAGGGGGGGAGGGGVMTGMVGGFRRVVGVERKKKTGPFDHLWTLILVAAVVAIIAWRFF